MKRFIMLSSLLLVGLFLVNSHNAFAQKEMKKEPVMWPAADIKWMDNPSKEAPPGIKMAPLWGDMGKGEYGTFVKFSEAMNNPLHTHSSDTRMVVLAGNFWVAPEGGEKKMFGPGSYVMVPSGWKHTSGADAGTTVFQEGPGKFDMQMVK